MLRWIILFVFSLSISANELIIFDFKDGKKNLYAQYTHKDNQTIVVWKPFIEEKDAWKYKWHHEATTEPYKYFSKHLNENMIKFRSIAHEFNKCVESKIWPLKRDCLGIVDYCFGKERATTCDIYLGAYKNLPYCEGLNFKQKCLMTSEKIFELYSHCLKLDKHIGFAFYPFGEDGNLKEYVAIRVNGSIDKTNKYKDLSCDFSIANGKLTVIGIQSNLGWNHIPEQPFP